MATEDAAKLAQLTRLYSPGFLVGFQAEGTSTGYGGSAEGAYQAALAGIPEGGLPQAVETAAVAPIQPASQSVLSQEQDVPFLGQRPSELTMAAIDAEPELLLTELRSGSAAEPGGSASLSGSLSFTPGAARRFVLDIALEQFPDRLSDLTDALVDEVTGRVLEDAQLRQRAGEAPSLDEYGPQVAMWLAEHLDAGAPGGGGGGGSGRSPLDEEIRRRQEELRKRQEQNDQRKEEIKRIEEEQARIQEIIRGVGGMQLPPLLAVMLDMLRLRLIELQKRHSELRSQDDSIEILKAHYEVLRLALKRDRRQGKIDKSEYEAKLAEIDKEERIALTGSDQDGAAGGDQAPPDVQKPQPEKDERPKLSEKQLLFLTEVESALAPPKKSIDRALQELGLDARSLTEALKMEIVKLAITLSKSPENKGLSREKLVEKAAIEYLAKLKQMISAMSLYWQIMTGGDASSAPGPAGTAQEAQQGEGEQTGTVLTGASDPTAQGIYWTLNWSEWRRVFGAKMPEEIEEQLGDMVVVDSSNKSTTIFLTPSNWRRLFGAKTPFAKVGTVRTSLSGATPSTAQGADQGQSQSQAADAVLTGAASDPTSDGIYWTLNWSEWRRVFGAKMPEEVEEQLGDMVVVDSTNKSTTIFLTPSNWRRLFGASKPFDKVGTVRTSPGSGVAGVAQSTSAGPSKTCCSSVAATLLPPLVETLETVVNSTTGSGKPPCDIKAAIDCLKKFVSSLAPAAGTGGGGGGSFELETTGGGGKGGGKPGKPGGKGNGKRDGTPFRDPKFIKPDEEEEEEQPGGGGGGGGPCDEEEIGAELSRQAPGLGTAARDALVEDACALMEQGLSPAAAVTEVLGRTGGASKAASGVRGAPAAQPTSAGSARSGAGARQRAAQSDSMRASRQPTSGPPTGGPSTGGGGEGAASRRPGQVDDRYRRILDLLRRARAAVAKGSGVSVQLISDQLLEQLADQLAEASRDDGLSTEDALRATAEPAIRQLSAYLRSALGEFADQLAALAEQMGLSLDRAVINRLARQLLDGSVDLDPASLREAAERRLSELAESTSSVLTLITADVQRYADAMNIELPDRFARQLAGQILRDSTLRTVSQQDAAIARTLAKWMLEGVPEELPADLDRERYRTDAAYRAMILERMKRREADLPAYDKKRYSTDEAYRRAVQRQRQVRHRLSFKSTKLSEQAKRGTGIAQTLSDPRWRDHAEYLRRWMDRHKDWPEWLKTRMVDEILRRELELGRIMTRDELRELYYDIRPSGSGTEWHAPWLLEGRVREIAATIEPPGGPSILKPDVLQHLIEIVSHSRNHDATAEEQDQYIAQLISNWVSGGRTSTPEAPAHDGLTVFKPVPMNEYWSKLYEGIVNRFAAATTASQERYGLDIYSAFALATLGELSGATNIAEAAYDVTIEGKRFKSWESRLATGLLGAVNVVPFAMGVTKLGKLAAKTRSLLAAARQSGRRLSILDAITEAQGPATGWSRVGDELRRLRRGSGAGEGRAKALSRMLSREARQARLAELGLYFRVAGEAGDAVQGQWQNLLDHFLHRFRRSKEFREFLEARVSPKIHVAESGAVDYGATVRVAHDKLAVVVGASVEAGERGVLHHTLLHELNHLYDDFLASNRLGPGASLDDILLKVTQPRMPKWVRGRLDAVHGPGTASKLDDLAVLAEEVRIERQTLQQLRKAGVRADLIVASERYISDYLRAGRRTAELLKEAGLAGWARKNIGFGNGPLISEFGLQVR